MVTEFRKFEDQVRCLLVSTGQHREILLDALSAFGLAPDIDLGIMTQGQSLAQVTSRALEGLDKVFSDQKPNIVLAQGDTTTTFVSSLAAFYQQIPFGHIEAGLRTTRIDNPFPEEFNRRATGLITKLHFAPTFWSRDNLVKESKDPNSIYVTGNTGIDAVLHIAAQEQTKWYSETSEDIVLLTSHRRENWGEPQRHIAKAALRLVEKFPNIRLVVALHPNPKVREVLTPILENHPRIDLIDPPEYKSFVGLMKRSKLILSDSGGVQEEAPSFGIPVLVLRDTTERPEGVTAGTAKLVGTDEETIFAEGSALLSDEMNYQAMAKAVSPYGDGGASARVRYHVLHELGIMSNEEPEWTY